MKRSRVSLSVEQSPVKRHRKDSIPATPYTPYPLNPLDSPSNPFKRKSHVVSLPPISSFRKHIPLRFQLHRRGLSFANGGVHRIVQVPLNYTFTHLRALIAWLFHVPAKHTNGKVGKEDYLFEIKTNVNMQAPRLKPGIIKSSDTSVKLSHPKDPRRSRDLDELEGDQSEDDQFGDDLDDGEGDWIWADEEDYTLDHVWVTGLKADMAIIYHHYPSTQVHITVNTTKLPRRRGKSNVPHVFSARGRVHLSPPPLPRPLFTRSISHTLSSSPAKPPSPHSFHTRRPDPKRGSIFSPNPFMPARPKGNKRKEIIFVEDSDEDQDELDELHSRLIDPKYWNESHYAFGRYLLSFLDPTGRSYAHLDDEYFEEKQPYDPFENDDDEGEEGGQGEIFVEEESLEQLSTPGLTSSSTRGGSSLPPSSPPALALSSSPSWHHDDRSPLILSPNLSLELHPSIIASHYPNKKYVFTPAPPIARKHRLQLERLERRIEKGKKGTYLCENDEEDVDEQDEEVDELFEDEEEARFKEGEAWDPFGDEEEI